MECITKAGTERWINFVEEYRIHWNENVNTKTDMASIIIINPPHLKTLRSIIKIAKDRHGSLFGQSCLIEFGLNRLKEALSKNDKLINSYNLAYRTHQRFGLVINAEVPILKLDFYNDADKDNGKIVIPLTKSQLVSVKNLSGSLGFVSGGNTEIALIILVCSVGDMLGLCCEGEFDKYCVEYLNNLKKDIISKGNVWNIYLNDNMDKIFQDINSKIIYYKETGEEYGIKFDAKIRCAYQLVEFFNNNTTINNHNDIENIKRKILKFNELIHKYKDLQEMLKVPDRHLEIETIKIIDKDFSDKNIIERQKKFIEASKKRKLPDTNKLEEEMEIIIG